MALLVVPFHLPTGPEGRLVDFVNDDPVLEIRLLRDGKVEGAPVERLDHAGVTYILSRRDWARRHAKRKTPGQERLARRDRFDGEAVADQNGGIEPELRAVMLNCQPGCQAARGDSDIVDGLGQASDGVKGDRRVQVGLGCRVRPVFVCHQGSPFRDMNFPRYALRFLRSDGLDRHPPHHHHDSQHHQE